MESKLSRAVEMMIKTDHMHKTLIASRASEIGMHRTQHRILMILDRHGKLPSQKELAEHLNITPAAVTCALKRIEADGYVEIVLGQDNRYRELFITEKGRELVLKTRSLFSATDRSLFEGFTDSELDTYINCLEKLQKNISLHLGRDEKKKTEGKKQ